MYGAVFLHCIERGGRVNPSINISAQALFLVCIVNGGHGGEKRNWCNMPKIAWPVSNGTKCEPRQSGLKNTALCCLFVDCSYNNFKANSIFKYFAPLSYVHTQGFLHHVFWFEGLENMITMGSMEKGARRPFWSHSQLPLAWVETNLWAFMWKHQMILLERKKNPLKDAHSNNSILGRGKD